MKEEVKARYADLALRDTPLSCCSGVYTPTDLADLPLQAAGLSLGCGNPVALASLQPDEVRPGHDGGYDPAGQPGGRAGWVQQR